MRLKVIALAVCGVGLATAYCVMQSGELAASDIQWKSIMGKRGADEHSAYVLMAQGFMGWPGLGGPNFPDELDKQIDHWVKEHPKAQVIPVAKMPLSEEFSFLYVWLIEGHEILNIDLVRKGLCEAQHMQVASGDLLIEKTRYEQFRVSVLDAEQQAITEKLGVWARPDMAGRSHWKKAELLEEQGKLEDAIKEFEQAADSDGGDVSSAWYRIAKLQEELGRAGDAIAALDRSIATATSEMESRWPQIEKARLLASQGKADSTQQVFGDLRSRCEDDLTPCLDAAVAVVPTSPAKAVEILEPPVLAFLTKHNILFDGDTVQFDAEKAKRSDKYWMSLQEVGSALPTLGGYCLRAGDVEKALSYTAKGISIKQNTWGAMAERLDPLTMEAADFEGRQVRAQAFIAKRMFDEAKRELDFAKVLVDTGQIQGGFVNEQIEHAYAELGKAFPDRQVSIPPKYEPARKAKAKEYTPVELQGMEEDALVSLAADTDNGVSFAALEELVKRHRNGQLTNPTAKKLIANGLAHQSNLKAEPMSRRTQASHWRGQYGVFIEDALKRKELADEDRIQYLKNMLGVYIDVDRMEVSGSPPLEISLGVQPRVAGSLVGRDMHKAKWTGTIRVEGGEIDGKPVSVRMRPSEDCVKTMGLMSGALDGLRCNATGYETLTPGMHTLTVHGQMEIREGDLGFRTKPEELAKVEPVSRNSFTVSAQFEVQK